MKGAVLDICNFLEIKLTDSQVEIIVDKNRYENRRQAVKAEKAQQVLLGNRGNYRKLSQLLI